MKRTEHPLRQILELTKDQWDQPAERDVVRDNFHKVRLCRTAARSGSVRIRCGRKGLLSHLQIKVLPELRKSWDPALAEGTMGHSS